MAGQTSEDRPLWILPKGDNEASAVMREIEGLGWETLLLFRGDLRQSRLFRDFQEAVAWAEEWREELERDGWFS